MKKLMTEERYAEMREKSGVTVQHTDDGERDALLVDGVDVWRYGAVESALRSLCAQRAELLDAIDALRRLPVIRTCGECRWCHPTDVCAHARAHIEQEIDGCALPPPEWCPLRNRGAR